MLNWFKRKVPFRSSPPINQETMQHDLSLVTTNEMITELLNRHDHGMIYLLKIRHEGQHHHIRRWRGNSHTVMGLCQDFQHRVYKDFEDHKDSIPDT